MAMVAVKELFAETYWFNEYFFVVHAQLSKQIGDNLLCLVFREFCVVLNKKIMDRFHLVIAGRERGFPPLCEEEKE